eukprot:TRINITY_DN286307_c0_g1_i1.p1 TRINITY_DN286307_c0_g1~~TRINITY_DN286307_c0_g1_i1.p1  ORF type:complete len:485 (-),score=95.41 TRINITY_DN286307_c0_g1_i1:98-1552(-)
MSKVDNPGFAPIDVELVKGKVFAAQKKPKNNVLLAYYKRGLFNGIFLPFYGRFWTNVFGNRSFVMQSLAFSSFCVLFIILAMATDALELYHSIPFVLYSVAGVVFFRAEKRSKSFSAANRNYIRKFNRHLRGVQFDLNIHKIRCETKDKSGRIYSKLLTLDELNKCIFSKIDKLIQRLEDPSIVVCGIVSGIVAAIPITLMGFNDSNGLSNGSDDTALGYGSQSSILFNKIDFELVIVDMSLEHLLLTMLGFMMCLSTMLFTFAIIMKLATVERDFKRRYLAAKFFSALTSSTRSKKLGLPHFRLHKVENVKMWLSLRSFLRRSWPYHHADVVCSSSCLILFALLAVSLGITLLDELMDMKNTIFFWEINAWIIVLSFFALRMMTLASRTNKLFLARSLLLAEQMNISIQLITTVASSKRKKLSGTNKVLKIVTNLIKELERPKQLGGLRIDKTHMRIARLVILSAISALVSDLLGFKMKLWKL